MFNKIKIIFLVTVGACVITSRAVADLNLPPPLVTHTIPLHQHKTASFNYNTINNVLWPIVNHYTAFPDIPEWYANSDRAPLPMPTHTHFLAQKLTLRDAIWVTLRNSPDVKNDEAQRISDKFALAVARWNFEPQFNDNFQFTRDFVSRQATVKTTGGVTLNTPFATKISTGFENDTKSYFDHRNTYNTTITQPLMNGGWLVPWHNYLDAVNTEKQAELTFKSDIMNTVSQVIQSYTQLVSAYNSLALERANLKTTEEEMKQDALKLKVGRMSRSNFLQESVTLQTNKLGVVTNENAVQVAYQTFLTTLGLVPTAHLRVDKHIDIKGFSEPDLQTCIRLALRYNVNYLGDKLAIQNAKRALSDAINGLMPTLTATGTFGFGNGQKTSQSLGVTFSVPIDDMAARQTELDAKIALEQAKIALTSERQTVVSNVTSQWKTIQSDWQQIQIGIAQVALQEHVVKNDRLLLRYGRTTMFDYLQDRNTLLSQQQGLVTNKIAYITDVATLDTTMGILLKRWNIKLRY